MIAWMLLAIGAISALAPWAWNVWSGTRRVHVTPDGNASATISCTSSKRVCERTWIVRRDERMRNEDATTVGSLRCYLIALSAASLERRDCVRRAGRCTASAWVRSVQPATECGAYCDASCSADAGSITPVCPAAGMNSSYAPDW